MAAVAQTCTKTSYGGSSSLYDCQGKAAALLSAITAG
jgi:hypothetical protein